MSRSCMWELAVAVCRNCLTERESKEAVRIWQRVVNYPKKSHERPAVVVIQRCDAEQHSAPNPHLF